MTRRDHCHGTEEVPRRAARADHEDGLGCTVRSDTTRGGGARRIGEELSVYFEALRPWFKKAQVDGGLRPGTTTDEATRMREPVLEARESCVRPMRSCTQSESVSASRGRRERRKR